MVSSPNYVRDYKQEAASESPERKKQRTARHRARAIYERAFGPIPSGYDVDHKRPLSKGGSDKITNLGLQRSSANRSYPRNPDGSMKPSYD